MPMNPCISPAKALAKDWRSFCQVIHDTQTPPPMAAMAPIAVCRMGAHQTVAIGRIIVIGVSLGEYHKSILGGRHQQAGGIQGGSPGVSYRRRSRYWLSRSI